MKSRLKAHFIDLKNTTYKRASRSPTCGDMISSRIFKLWTKMKSKLKVHFIDLKNSVSVIGFLATFNYACDTKNVHESAVMLVLP